MPTVLDLITASLQDLGVLAEGEVPSAAASSDALSALNRILDQQASERLMVYKVTRTTWSITANDGTYTVGSGGNVNIAWPQFIQHVNFIDTSQDPDLEIPMTPLSDDAWAAVHQKSLTSPFPSCWYFDRNFATGLGTLNLWPVPTSANLSGALYAATQVSEFAAITDTVYLPPGYRDMLVSALAYRLAPSYGRADMLPALKELRDEARRIVKNANSPVMDMSIDAGALPSRGPVYSIYSDT